MRVRKKLGEKSEFLITLLTEQYKIKEIGRKERNFDNIPDKGLVVRQCVLCPITLTPMLIRCNQEIIVEEEGEASLIASTSNRPTSIATLNDASEGMNPHQRDHPMGVTPTSFLMDFQMDGILRGLQALLPCHPLSLWSFQGTVTANEFGQYRLEVSLALTEEEGDQMISELAGIDRSESPEVFWEGSTDLGQEYDNNGEL